MIFISLFGGMTNYSPKNIIYFKLGKVEFLNEISELRLSDRGSCMQRETAYNP
jgi:hypothetical protein